MLGYQISSLLSLAPIVYKKFLGLYCYWNLPTEIKRGTFIVINTVGHWVILFHHPNRHGCIKLYMSKYGICQLFSLHYRTYELFDSLAQQSATTWLHHLKGVRGTLQTNKRQYQEDSSISCALFVITYIVHRFYNLELTFKECLKVTFSKKSLSKNEKRVAKTIKRLNKGF
jgi:hypothetical protein